MWKNLIRFVCRYLAIGVLVGIGIYAVDEIHWRLFGSERVAELQQSIDGFEESLMPDSGPLLNRSEETQSESLASDDTSGEPDPWRPNPYFVNGEIQGYRVYPGSDLHIFKSLGLRPGDLVTEIDGQPLNEPAVALELFAKGLSGQPVIFGVLRGDELQKIEIKVD